MNDDAYTKDAIAGEDLRRGDVVGIMEEGEERYAYSVNATRPDFMPDGICDRAASKGDKIRVYKSRTWDRLRGLRSIFD